MSAYMVEMVEVVGYALSARVRFEGPDGRSESKAYSWPIGTSRRDIEAALRDLYAAWLAQPAKPEVVHEVMELVGVPLTPDP